MAQATQLLLQFAQLPRVKFDISSLKSSYCNVCNGSSMREEVVLNFGINTTWDCAAGEDWLDVALHHCIIMLLYVAKCVRDMMVCLMEEHEVCYGKLDGQIMVIVEGRGSIGGMQAVLALEVISLDVGLWSVFSCAGNEVVFLTVWLGLLLNWLLGVEVGAVLEVDYGAGAFVFWAVAPDLRCDLVDLVGIVECAFVSVRLLAEADADIGQT